MIDKDKNPVEWSTFAYNLEDAHEHLTELIKNMDDDNFGEIEFGVQIAHIYEHLSRAWNARNLERDYGDKESKQLSKFPKDLLPGDLTVAPLLIKKSD